LSTEYWLSFGQLLAGSNSILSLTLADLRFEMPEEWIAEGLGGTPFDEVSLFEGAFPHGISFFGYCKLHDL
jgi:hypothetical protein